MRRARVWQTLASTLAVSHDSQRNQFAFLFVYRDTGLHTWTGHTHTHAETLGHAYTHAHTSGSERCGGRERDKLISDEFWGGMGTHHTG